MVWPLIKRPSYYHYQWIANLALICFFIGSFLFVIVYTLLINEFFTNYFYATLFLLGGFYVFWMSHLSSKTIEKIKTMDNLKLEYEKIRYNAEHDKLTGCFNRHYLMEILDNRFKKIKLNTGQLTVMFVDLDGFKKINDEYGHDFGDQILQRFGQLLKQQLREEDIIARYGGDEFVVLVENIPLTKAKSIGQKIIQTTSRITKEKLPNHSSLGCSVGITQLTKNSLSINSVLKKADDAFYKAKKNHGNTIWVDDNMPASFLD
ncbi:TPA: GGDEF domain-containing protein [Legionella pneumophila]